MVEKSQFNARIEKDVVDKVRAFDKSNTDIASEALGMWLRAHGLDTPEGIKREIETLDSEIESIRARANQEIAEKQERRDQLTEALETMLAQQSDTEAIIKSIAHGLSDNPNRTMDGFKDEVRSLLEGAEYQVRDEVIEDVRSYAKENDRTITPDQLRPNASTPNVAMADGSGADASTGIDTGRYNFGESE